MIPFGQILQRLRNEKRWSQSKLAEKLGLSASQVANYEMGRRLPSLQILKEESLVFLHEHLHENHILRND